MSNRKDITGNVYGHITVLEHIKGHDWLCRCVCGKEWAVKSISLRKGNTKSCGCMRNAMIAEKKTIHGLYGSHIYKSYHKIKQRCEYEKSNRYSSYGGRGIKLSAEWSNNFKAFYDYIVSELGECPAQGYTIDRIDVHKGYEPGNLRWADPITQANNKTNTKYVTFRGETKTLREWSEELGICYSTLSTRLHRGWPIEDAFGFGVFKDFNGYSTHTGTARNQFLTGEADA